MLNTYPQTGGAAVATQRISEALETHTDLEVKQYAFSGEFNNLNDLQKVWANTYIKKKRAWLNFVFERLSIWRKVINRETLFSFSPANIGIDLHKVPEVKEADILHLHWLNFGFLSLKGLEKLAKLNKPIVWTLHDMWTFTGGCHYAGNCENYLSNCGKCPLLKTTQEKDLSFQVFKKKQEIFKHNNNFYFTAPSLWIQSVAQKSKLLSDKMIEHITHPLDTIFFNFLDKKTLHKKYGFSTEKKFLLFGAMNVKHERKGFQYLKRALEIWIDKFPEWKDKAELLVFGKADEEILKGLSLPVHYLGSIQNTEKLKEIFNLAHIFLMPTLEEVLGYTVLEAMACEVPVVAFNTGGVPDMITHKENGYLAESRNAEDLAEGMQWILKETDYNILQKNAREDVLANHHYKIIAQKYISFYQEILKNN